jgi:hypothetical protein
MCSRAKLCLSVALASNGFSLCFDAWNAQYLELKLSQSRFDRLFIKVGGDDQSGHQVGRASEPKEARRGCLQKARISNDRSCSIIATVVLQYIC